MRLERLVGAVVMALWAAAGCGDSDPPDPEPPLLVDLDCEPDDVRECVGAPECQEQATQTCFSTGVGWSACTCPQGSGGAAGADAGGAAGGAGEGGEGGEGGSSGGSGGGGGSSSTASGGTSSGGSSGNGGGTSAAGGTTGVGGTGAISGSAGQAGEGP